MNREELARQPIDPTLLETHTFDWGIIKWLVTPDALQAGLTFGEVVLLPGKAHTRHNHASAEEILHFLSGHGQQMVDDEEPFPVGAGDTVYVPLGVYHSTENTGWQPLRFIAVYNPGGIEEKLLEELPDHERIAPGSTATWGRQE